MARKCPRSGDGKYYVRGRDCRFPTRFVFIYTHPRFSCGVGLLHNTDDRVITGLVQHISVVGGQGGGVGGMGGGGIRVFLVLRICLFCITVIYQIYPDYIF